MRKRAHATAGQLALPLVGDTPSSLTSPATRLAEASALSSRVSLDNLPASALIIPVESTFDTCQGIREAKIALQAHDVVIFDARHLELAERSVGGASDPLATYVTDRGGNYMSLAPFLNVLRCSASLSRWRIKEQLPPLTFAHIPPREGTKARDLWEALGMEQLFEQMRAPRTLGSLPVRAFESRYVSPILVVTKANRQPVLASIHGWIDHIAPASGALRDHLIWAVPEIVTNLVKHGLGGLLVLSIWPAGQVEILWSNRIDHLPQWPPEDTAKGLANALLYDNGGGDGMHYIFDQLLPPYRGVLAVNYKANSVIFYAGRRCDIYGQGRRSDAFLPDSILFTLQLFSADVRVRSVT